MGTAPAPAGMNEQGRATVVGWQQAVNAAWERQSGLLAPTGPIPGPPDAGSGAADLDAARKQFFGPVPPGVQRQILQTNAKDPASKDGIIVSRYYISDPTLALGTLHGDGRGPTTDPKAPYRFLVAWDTNTGEVSMTVQPSTINNYVLPDVVVPARPINTAPGGDVNNFVVDEAAPGHLKVSYNVLDSITPTGQVNGSFDLKMDPSNIYVNLHGDNYPDGEVIQYRPDGTRTLTTKPMSPWKELGVIPDVDQFDHFRAVPR